MHPALKQKTMKLVIKSLFSAGLPAVVLWYLFSKIRLDDFFLTIRSISVPWILLGLLTYSANQVFRTIRFFCLTHSGKPDLGRLFRVQSLYIFLNYLLPFRTGELSYIYLAKKYLDIPVANCISSLAVARFSDYLLLMSCYVFISFQAKLAVPSWFGFISKGGILCVLLVVCVVLMYIFKDNRYFLRFSRKIKGYPLWQENKVVRKITGHLQKIVSSFKEISNVRIFVFTVLTTAATWACIFFTFHIIVRSLGHHVNFFQIILISLMAMMARLFQGVANFGSHEAGWYGALLVIGFSSKDAGVVAVSSHLIILGYMCLITLYSRLTLKRVI